MKDLLVVDCSLIMSGLLPDEDYDIRWLQDYTVCVPTIFYLECSNVLCSAWKRRRVHEDTFGYYIKSLHDLASNIDGSGMSLEVVNDLLKLATRFNLSAYDASYLELALRLGIQLATHDRKLIAACESAGVRVIHKVETIEA